MNNKNIAHKNLFKRTIVMIVVVVMLCSTILNTNLTNKFVTDNITNADAANVTNVYCYIKDEVPLASDYSNWMETNYWGIWAWNETTSNPILYRNGSWSEVSENWENAGRYRGTKGSDGWYKYTLPANGNYYFNLESISGTFTQDYFSNGGTYYFGYSTKTGWIGSTTNKENVSIRLAGGSLSEQEKVDDKTFNLKEDGYSFRNGRDGLSIEDDNYKIPYSIYTDVYGSKYTEEHYKSAPKWNGSCFGMVATAILFNEGRLNKNQYIGGNNTTINEGAGSGIKEKGNWFWSQGYYSYIDENSELKKLIERYQVWQTSEEGCKARSDFFFYQESETTIYNTIKNLLDELKMYNNIQLSVRWNEGKKNYGHSLAVDTSRPYKDLGNGWYRIYLYDPNNPYYDEFGEKEPVSYYSSSSNRYIDVNINTNHWKINVQVNGDSIGVPVGYTDDDEYIIGSEVYFRNVEGKFTANIDGNATFYNVSSETTSMDISCNDIVIYDSSNTIVLEISNNEVVYVSDSIDIITEFYFGNDTETEDLFKGQITLPFDDYHIVFTSEGTAQVFNQDYFIGLVGDANSSIMVSADGNVSVNGETNSSVDVALENYNDTGEFTSVSCNVVNDGETSTNITLQEDNFNVDTENDASIDVKVNSDKADNAYLLTDITEIALDNVNISEYAIENGELVPNNLEYASVTCVDAIEYDGYEHEIRPVVTYCGQTLIEGVDYTLSGDVSAYDIGEYTINIIGQGNYTGTLEVVYNIIPGIKFSGASLTLHNDLTVNYKVSKSLFEDAGFENPYVIFQFGSDIITVDDYVEDDEYYWFNFDNIAPNQINDTIYATLYATYNGVEYASEVRAYSVATYCYNMLNKYSSDEYAELRTLLVDLLNYGTESQIYTDYNTDNLVNASLTDEQAVWGTSETPIFETVMDQNYAVIDNPTVTWKGAGLNLLDSVTMRFKIATDSVDDLTVKVTSDIGEWNISSDTFEQTNGGYYVFFEGLNAGQMSEPVYLTVYNGDIAVSNTIRYSIESYAYSKQNSSDEKLNNLLVSMIKYGNSAYAYIQNANIDNENSEDIDEANYTNVYCYIARDNAIEDYLGIWVWNPASGNPIYYNSDGVWRENIYDYNSGRYIGTKNSEGWYKYNLPLTLLGFNLESASGGVVGDFITEGGNFYLGYSIETGWVFGNSQEEILSALQIE